MNYDAQSYFQANPNKINSSIARLGSDKQLAKADFVRDLILKHCTELPVVADICCGSAYLSSQLPFQEYIGVDHPNMIELHTTPHSTVSFIAFDFEEKGELNLESAIDVAVSFETIEHITNPNKFLYQIHRNLREDGYLILSTPNNPQDLSPRYNDHVKEYTLSELSAIIESSGFKIRENFALGVPFGLLTSFLRKNKVKVYRTEKSGQRSFLSRLSDHLSPIRKIYSQIVPYNLFGVPIGETGENIIIVAQKL